MAYPHDIAVTTQASTTAATYPMNMPDHAIGDLLVWYASCDAGTLTPSGSAYTAIGANPTSTTTNIIISAAGYRIATTASETLSLATTDVASCIVVCFKEVDGTTPFDGVAIDFTAVNTATSTPVSVSRTSTTANALYVSMIAQAGANPMAVSSPGAMWAALSDAGGTTDTLSAHNAFAWSFKRAAGATPVINWASNLSMQYTRLSFVLRASAGARVPPYIDGVALLPATLVHLGSHTTTLNGASVSTNGITATINGKTATPSTATLLADSGVDPYTSILTSAAAATAVGALVGPEITRTAAMDFTGKLLAGAVMAGNWKQGKFGVGSVKQGGVVVRLGSGTAPTTAWNAYQVSAKDAQVPSVTPTVFVVEPGYAATAYATGAGGNCSVSAVKFAQCLRNAPSFSSQVGLTEWYMVDKQVIAGGDATYPVGLDELVDIGKSFRLPLIQKAGASSVVCFAPVQLGGGDAIYFNADGGVIQFPNRASVTKKDLQYHASDNKLGLYDAGKSGDTIKFTNGLITSPISQIFEITSAATSAATRDYTGTTIKGLTVTLRNVMTFTGMTFSGCPSVTFANACTMTDSTFKSVPTITQGASTITGSVFSASKVISASPTDMDNISGCTFTSSGTGHAIEVGSATAVPGTPLSITFTNNTFSGYASGNGSTGNEAINVLYTSGVLNISITGGTTPSIKTAGATVNVTNDKLITVTVKDSATLAAVENARVRIVTTVGGNLVIEGVTNSSGVLTGSTSYVGSAVTGTVRRATPGTSFPPINSGTGFGTRYKVYDVSGTVGSGGLDVTALMTSDE